MIQEQIFVSTLNDHEIIQIFRNHVYPLSNKLTEMLNEHYTHQTERRGCGYTQATRVLGEYINIPRDAQELNDLNLFNQFDTKSLKQLLEQQSIQPIHITDWHNLDQNLEIVTFLAEHCHESFAEQLEQAVSFQKNLRHIAQHAQLEESQVLSQLIADVILPHNCHDTMLTQLHTLQEKPKVGSCPMAENFFLKIAHGKILRQGRINIIVDEQNTPLLLEKINMGDDHSCISLQPLLMNGVRIPAGALFSIHYDADTISTFPACPDFKGHIIPYTAIQGFWFLRLTTLAISPENRARAFSTHYAQQVANGLYSPGSTQLQQLVDLAQRQISELKSC
ncbi:MULTISPECIES: hypothetical protein [Acinetobacter]|uniref:Uncharacterized protein n=1 Tax=Acinetobacter parvus DSM 16617 = CIP 108168 TaxID=981333 RepID=N8RQN1_9GAMM|nr:MULTISPECIES: hypothetical protein [Acinetobacter]ENU36427.1 hypothetical protein F988_01466 [Acinetobacter parvus DSM 16617 = CIP 108168]ENU82486.1 hypothetical protein F974_02408 [Acinetobacter sp. CIP 102159]ENU89395.1 hypothetical protein F972_01367 [Acinetobacter sp. CIP 102529]ENU96513.1 hypothetical protein F970_00703 [Acinetobacter sp. CIP 102082]ENX63447.1 hypothetical protein F884_02084 [Acinetobacter sp. CIP 102143]